MSGFAWVTLATNDSYSLGALVVANSLRRVGTAHQLAVLITPGVSPTMREQLASVFDTVQEVNVLDSNDESNLALLARPDLGITFTKLHCWTLTQYAKCVFLDADTLVLQPCDELFDRNELSAAPDVGWPDCFNSGVFVYRPSLETFRSILDLALTRGSFDGGDQGLLNLYFNDWSTQDASRRLPFIYNMCSTACYSYLPAFKQFGSEAKIVHFIGAVKPWLLALDTQTGLVNSGSEGEHLRGLLQLWWSLFLTQVLPKLKPDMSLEGSSMVFENSPEPLAAARHFATTEPSPDLQQSFTDPWDNYHPNNTCVQTNIEHAPVPNDPLTHQHHSLTTPAYECTNGQEHAYLSGYSKPTSYPYQNHNLNGNECITSQINIANVPISKSNSQCFSQHSKVNEVLYNSQPQNDSEHERKLNVQVNESHHVSSVQTHQNNPPENYSSDHVLNGPKEVSHTQSQFTDIPSSHDNRSIPSTSSDLRTSPENNIDGATECILVPNEETEDCGMAGALSQLSIGSPRSEQQAALEEHWRRQAWEQGQIDYLGKDAFDKIWAKIVNTLTISAPPTESPEACSQPSADPSPGESPPAPEAVTTPTEPLEPTGSQVLDTLPVQSSEHTALSTPIAELPPVLATEPIALSTPIAELPPVLATEPIAVPSPMAELPMVLATEPFAIPSPIAELPPVLATEPIASSSPITELPPVLATEPIALSTPEAELPPVLATESIALSAPIAELPPVLATEPTASSTAIAELPPVLATEPIALPSSIAELPPVLATEPIGLPSPITELPPVLATEPIALPTPITELPPVLATEPIALPSPVAELLPVLATEPIALPSPVAELPPVLAPVAELPPVLAPVPVTIQCAKAASVPSSPPSSLVPRTPTVTDATPPTSPPIGPLSTPTSPRALGVGSVTPPETPPVGSTGNLQGASANQSDAEAAPIPPKRRGGPNKGGKAAVQKAKK